VNDARAPPSCAARGRGRGRRRPDAAARRCSRARTGRCGSSPAAPRVASTHARCRAPSPWRSRRCGAPSFGALATWLGAAAGAALARLAQRAFPRASKGAAKGGKMRAGARAGVSGAAR
jgi:hypothetical protein